MKVVTLLDIKRFFLVTMDTVLFLLMSVDTPRKKLILLYNSIKIFLQ